MVIWKDFANLSALSALWKESKEHGCLDRAGCESSTEDNLYPYVRSVNILYVQQLKDPCLSFMMRNIYSDSITLPPLRPSQVQIFV